MNTEIIKTLNGITVVGNYLDKSLQKSVGDFNSKLQERNSIAEKMQDLEDDLFKIDNQGRPSNAGFILDINKIPCEPQQDFQAAGRRKLEILRSMKSLSRQIMPVTIELGSKRLELLPIVQQAAEIENMRLIQAYDKTRSELIQKLIALTIPGDVAEAVADSASCVIQAAGLGGVSSEGALVQQSFMQQHFQNHYCLVGLTYDRLLKCGDGRQWRRTVEACHGEMLKLELAAA